MSPDDVLAFWFAEPVTDPTSLMSNVRRWFQGGPDMDVDVRARFGGAVEAALAGELDGWTSTARGTLALVILLDQLTRNVFRGDPRTYEGDPVAQRLALDAFERGVDKELAFAERLFLSMPLLHSESLAHHERLAPIAAQLSEEAPPVYAAMCAMHREQVAKYLDIIQRFGRFPHRNELLGRASSPAELDFLRDWAERAAPSGAR